MAFKMKGFEPHNMYKTEKAETHKEHLALKNKGYDHSPYNKKGKKRKKCDCWKGYERVPGTKPCTKKSCRKKK